MQSVARAITGSLLLGACAASPPAPTTGARADSSPPSVADASATMVDASSASSASPDASALATNVRDDCGASFPRVGSAWLEQSVRSTTSNASSQDAEEESDIEIVRKKIVASSDAAISIETSRIGGGHLVLGFGRRKTTPSASGTAGVADEPPDTIAAALARHAPRGAPDPVLAKAVRAFAAARGLTALQNSRVSAKFTGTTQLAWGDALDTFEIAFDENETARAMGSDHLSTLAIKGTLVARKTWLVALELEGTATSDRNARRETLAFTRPCLRTHAGNVARAKPCVAVGGFCADACPSGSRAQDRGVCINATCCAPDTKGAIVRLPVDPPSPEGGLCAGLNESPKCGAGLECAIDRPDAFGRCVAPP